MELHTTTTSFFSSRRRHTRYIGDWSSDVCSSDLDFLRRGLATLTIDGPGQGENAPRFPIRADWSSVVSPLLDHLSADERGIDLGRVGLRSEERRVGNEGRSWLSWSY